MSVKRVSSKRPLAADIVGLPARRLADMLDEILAERPGAPPPSGLFRMAETLRLELSLPAGEADDGPPPDEGGEDLIPELRIVQTLLAHMPRPPDRADQPVAAPDHPAPTGGEMQMLPDPSTLAEDYDLDAIRRALRTFAGEPLPDAVFDEVVDITAELAGKPRPIREIAPLPTTEPLDDPDRGDRLLAEIKAIQASLAEDGDLIAAPSTEIAPLPEPIPAPEPMAVIEGAPPEPAPEPAPPQPVAKQRQVKAKPTRQRKAAPPPPPEDIVPPAEPAAMPEQVAEPAPTLPEPVAAVRPFKVKVKPTRQSKGAPAQPDEAIPQPTAAAPALPAETAQPAETSAQPAEPEPPVTPMMAEAPGPQPEPDVPPAEDDVLVLTEDLAVPASEVPAFAEAAVTMDDAGFATAAQAEVITEPMSPPPASPVEAPEPAADAGASAARGDVVALIEAVIAAHRPPDAPGAMRGDGTLPERVEVLESLLADPPPANDFIALDLLAECWGKGAQAIPSRALLAVAQNLSRNFGLPGKLPMASSKAWRMLDSEVFQEELAHRLIAIGAFISDWQRTQRTFLILEFGEIELVEHLFEALRPADYLDLLADVMNFKVLSNRRMGLLRRIPNRVRKQVQPMLPDRADEALVLLAHTKALLEKLADPNGFTPIVDAATKALEEVEKLMKLAAAATAPPQLPGPPGAGGGMALGRIGA